MRNRDLYTAQLPLVLSRTEFPFLSERYEGKVRDTYAFGRSRILVATDRLSCFDRVVTTIPFKGQVLSQLATTWFRKIEHIVSHHLEEVLDPNVVLVKDCAILPVEVVVRGYLTGSAYRDYAAGRGISGVQLPPGLTEYQKLPSVLITPSTKAARGEHDLPIGEAEIVSQGIVPARVWAEVREKALALFAFGQQEAAQQGLMLVDTKYEFGLCEGKVTLADEIHTLDSSRYWIEKSYRERISRGEAPEMLDKEPVRQWLLTKGFKGDGTIPEFTDEYRISLTDHYVRSFEHITGTPFVPVPGDTAARIEKILRTLMHRE